MNYEELLEVLKIYEDDLLEENKNNKHIQRVIENLKLELRILSLIEIARQHCDKPR